MSQGTVLQVFQEAITTIITVSAPILLVGLVIGLAVSVIQAMTQINEQTMVFIPKIVGILLSLLLFGGWMLTKLCEFTVRLFASIPGLVQ